MDPSADKQKRRRFLQAAALKTIISLTISLSSAAG
jgi:hypothetical protein